MTDTVIIGAGQAGLAVGYHLDRRGLDFVILDANERVGDSWRGRRGFRPDYRLLDLPGFAAANERGIVAPHPGLYFIGEFFLYSMTSSLIDGVGRDAGHIAEQIAGRAWSACRAQASRPPRRRGWHRRRSYSADQAQ